MEKQGKLMLEKPVKPSTTRSWLNPVRVEQFRKPKPSCPVPPGS